MVQIDANIGFLKAPEMLQIVSVTSRRTCPAEVQEIRCENTEHGTSIVKSTIINIAIPFKSFFVNTIIPFIKPATWVKCWSEALVMLSFLATGKLHLRIVSCWRDELEMLVSLVLLQRTLSRHKLLRELQEVEIQCPMSPPEKVAHSLTSLRFKSTRDAKLPGCNTSPWPFKFSFSSLNDWQFERQGGITKSS